MNILRQVDIFENQTNNLIQEMPIDKFDLEIFKKKFKTKNEDPLMYDPYEITSSTVDLFPEINFDFEKYSYFIVCYQV
jgi:hypothetical protein